MRLLDAGGGDDHLSWDACAAGEGALADASRDERAEREDEPRRNQLGPEANYRTPPGGSV
jgi:hypothetical protein